MGSTIQAWVALMIRKTSRQCFFDNQNTVRFLSQSSVDRAKYDPLVPTRTKTCLRRQNFKGTVEVLPNKH